MPLRNAPSATLATLSNIGERLSRRTTAVDVETPTVSALRQQVAAAVPDTPQVDAFSVNAKPLGWFDTKLVLKRGETVTLLGTGVVHIARALKLSMLPKAVMWWRIGDNEIHCAPGESWTFTADDDGPLRLAGLPPGSFADRQGSIEKSPLHALMSGGLTVAVVRWKGDVEAGLRHAAERNAGLFAAALRRHLRPVQPPKDWHYLWRLGEGEIYTAQEDELISETHCDVGILQFPVDVPLTDTLQLQWRWRADQLPSKRAEHIDLTHDYLSIAVEFDNGLDLTYMWSAALKPGTVFQCPLPWWKERETHWVVRALPGDRLGEWLDESQLMRSNYDTAIGGQAPQRVVAIWLIANSLFQRGAGRCAYRDIQLVDGAQVTPIRVVPPDVPAG